MDLRARDLALLLCLGLLAVGGCPFRSVSVDTPADGTLTDDAAFSSSTRVGANFDPASVQLRVDGVDLIAALGLTPPFSDESGAVLVGADVWAVSSFSFQQLPSGPWTIAVELAGVPLGAHTLTASAARLADGSLASDSAAIERVGGFALEAAAIAAGGRPGGPEIPLVGFAVHGSAALAQPFAAPPVDLSDGGELRSGIVAVSGALIAGASP